MNLTVPFLDLKRESETSSSEVKEALERVTRRGRYILGPEVEAFEAEFASYLGVPFAVGVASGTDALTLALEATHAVTPGCGHEVIVPAISTGFTALAIHHAGAVPRFVDLDPETLQFDLNRLEACVNERTRAIMPVHLYGYVCDMLSLVSWAGEHGLVVIEDACQAHGSSRSGQRAGSFGRAAAFSFYPTKNLGALGDGGLIATHDEDVFQLARKLRHGGQNRTFRHEVLGRNSRLDEIQAAILRFKLRNLESRNARGRKLADRYDKGLADLKLKVLSVISDMTPNRHIYPIRTPRRDELREFLLREGVETMIHYPVPLPHQPAFRSFVAGNEKFPVAEAAARELLSLPLYPELSEDEFEFTLRSIKQFFNSEVIKHE
jgi:dTDP-4-amino-4,6-dideoxygalactose transaminase